MRKQLLAFGLILVWGALVASTFWRMELRFLRPAERPQGARAIDPTTRPQVPLSGLHTDRGVIPLRGALTLVNFWSPDCACSRFMERHVRELVETYRPRGVRFITVIIADRENPSTLLHLWQRTGIDTPAVPDPEGAIARQMGVWAGPAGLFLTKRGELPISAHTTSGATVITSGPPMLSKRWRHC